MSGEISARGDVAVIGAGPGGLGAAYRLTEAGYRVHVFDDRDYPGGKMRTTRRDGFLIDEGPQIMPSGYHNVLGIARDSGMGEEILDAGSVFGYRGPDKLHFIDTRHMLRSGLKFDLLSMRGKLAMARLILDTDGRTTRRIHRGLDEKRTEFLDHLRYTTHVNVIAGLSRAPKDNPAFWINIPAAVAPGLIVMTLEHNKHPNRAPAGKGLLHVDCTAQWAAELTGKDDSVVVKEVMEAADAILPGVGSDVEFADVHRWDPMVLHSYPGYYRDLKAFSARCRELDGRIQIGGDFFCQSSINSATAAGERAARNLRAPLG